MWCHCPSSGALRDFVAVGGAVALPPRHAMGVWFTRWYDFSQETALDVVRDFETHGLPLDVLVLDMNWHTKDDWTGYTFDARLYPYPEDLFDDLHSLGLLAAGNLHDATGVGAWEARYAALCDALGRDASAGATVPYNISDEAAQLALEDVVLQPLEDKSVRTNEPSVLPFVGSRSSSRTNVVAVARGGQAVHSFARRVHTRTRARCQWACRVSLGGRS